MGDMKRSRWYHRAWWRARALRPRTARVVLWGHRGLDLPCRPLTAVDPSHPLSRQETFLAWLRDCGFDPTEVYLVEFGTVGFRVHRWARDASGKVVVERDQAGRYQPARQPECDRVYPAPLPFSWPTLPA